MFITPASFSELKYNVTMLLVGHLELLLVFCQKKFGYYGCKYKEEFKEEEGDCST